MLFRDFFIELQICRIIEFICIYSLYLQGNKILGEIQQVSHLVTLYDGRVFLQTLRYRAGSAMEKKQYSGATDRALISIKLSHSDFIRRK